MTGLPRLRRLLAAAAILGLALLVTGGALSVFFERHVERVARAELEGLAGDLVAGLDPGGPPLRIAAADPRYDQPYSGLYWQVERVPGRLERSRSLGDHVLLWPEAAPEAGAPRFVVLPGPAGGQLWVLDQRLDRPGGGLRLAVAVERAEPAAAGFRRDLAGGLAVTLFAAAVVAALVALGLRVVPGRLDAWARRLRPGAADRHERSPRGREIDGPPAAGEAERLSVSRAAVGSQRPADAEEIRARRAAGRAGAAADPQAVVRAVVDVLSRRPIGAELDWRIRGEAGPVALDPADLAEAVGALAENAARHATACVEITLQASGAEALIAVRDDGAGIPATVLERLRDGGMRPDHPPGGTGPGLAIASDIADAAGGRLVLGNLASGGGPGGLQATLHLPLIP